MENTSSSTTVPTTATPVKRNPITLETKIEILTLLKNGKKTCEVANMFNMAISTICTIKKNSPQIMNSNNFRAMYADRKRFRKPQNELVEEAILIWFNQMCSVGTSINGPHLASKSVEFYGRVDKNIDFKASPGWLQNFKQRNNFRKSLGQGETPPVGSSIAEEFVRSSTGKYQKINIYNADETVLLWKHLPNFNTTFEKNKVTLLACTNSTGTHKLKLTVVGQYESPQALKNFTQANPSPVNYFHSPNAWMTSTLFEKWFINHFTQEVADYQERAGITGDVLLLIDSAPCHPKIEEVTIRNINFKVMFFPPNLTSLLQPMDQGITTLLKKHYRRILLQQSSFVEPDCLKNYYNGLGLYNCIQFVVHSWELVSPKTILNCWKVPDKIKVPGKRKVPKYDNDKISEDCLVLLHALPGYEHCTLTDVSDWMNSEQGEYPFQLLSDLEILEEAKRKIHPSEPASDSVFRPKRELQVKKSDPMRLKRAYEMVIAHAQTLPEAPLDIATLKRIYKTFD